MALLSFSNLPTTMPPKLTTGLPGLDKVLKGIMPGDNIVWQVDEVADYAALVAPYAAAALRSRRRLIYFRFASHEQLIPGEFGAEIHTPRSVAGL